ncbi:hypothetical protein [Hymenobacter coalescens]
MNTPASDRITLYHRHHARQQRAKGLSHLVPAMVLLGSVLGLLKGEAWSWVTVAEVVVGAAYLALLVRELLHLRRHPHHREPVAWLELAAAAILALEGYHIWHRHHEAALSSGVHRFHTLPWLYWALALVFVGLAFGLRRLDARRFLHLHPEGFSLRKHPFALARHWRWAELDAVVPAAPAEVLVRRRDGREQRISFANMHDSAALRDRLLAHAAAHMPAR